MRHSESFAKTALRMPECGEKISTSEDIVHKKMGNVIVNKLENSKSFESNVDVIRSFSQKKFNCLTQQEEL